MAIVINGSNNTISGLAVGGLPDGCIDTDMIAANAVSSGKLASAAITAGAMPSGSIIQYKYATMTGNDQGYNSDSDADVSGMNVSIAKTNASNLIVCEISFLPYFGGTSGMRMNLKINRDSTEIYSAPYGVFRSGSVWKSSQSLIRKVDTGVNDTNSHTYKFTVKREEGSDELWLSNTPTHTITVMEVVA